VDAAVAAGCRRHGFRAVRAQPARRHPLSALRNWHAPAALRHPGAAVRQRNRYQYCSCQRNGGGRYRCNFMVMKRRPNAGPPRPRGARPFLRAARIPLAMGLRFDLVKYAQDYSHAQAILLDAHVDGYGGGGKAFNWSLLPPSVSSHLVLSGGLTPANVTDGILQVRPRGLSLAVDVSSGVEADGPDGKPIKGIKDADKIQRFVAAVRAADAQLAKNPHEFLPAT
jgi:hypothetical protein